MGLLIAGVLLWSAVHLFPGVASAARLRLIEKLGQGAYRGLYSVLILTSVVLMVFGWRSATPSIIYNPPDGMRIATAFLMVIALILFVSSRIPTDLKRVLRHPQLTGVLMWAIAHLLSNGDSRSLVLFGGLGLWAVLEMIAINRREKEWLKPNAVGMKRSAIAVVVGSIAWLVLVLVHPWLSGVSVMPGE